MEHNAGTASRALNDTIALEIQVAMLRRGWNQADLAEHMGKSEMWVSRRIKIKGDRQQMTVNELPLFAEALGVDLFDLMGLTRKDSLSWKIPMPRRPRHSAIRTIVPAAAERFTGRAARPTPTPRPQKSVQAADQAPRRLYRIPG